MQTGIYEKLGVDADKRNVREIFSRLNDNAYPGAFVNVIPDPFNPKKVLTQHQDGDGSKFVQRMLEYSVTKDKNVFSGMADDALSMNTGDIAAAGFVFDPWVITSVLNLNLSKEIKETVMSQVATRLIELRELYAENGFVIKFLGGETADLPDQVRSGVFDMAITAQANKGDVISGNVQDGDIIYGFASDGQTLWEPRPNSGLMSNGLTMARSVLMNRRYNQKFPALKRAGKFYKGRFDYDFCPNILQGMSVGEALLSPTRQWAIVIKKIIIALKKKNASHLLHGITMNTGGGATKILNLGLGGIEYVKGMPIAPPICQLIQKESQESWHNMYKSFNCGVGIDVVGEHNPILNTVLKQVAHDCGLPLYTMGVCLRFADEKNAKNKVTLGTPYGSFQYAPKD
ncbi:MAG: hypothetical protein WC905_00735 [Patescibacteria group bacterium]|jgi:phosphoribosylformylglycinamidine cyclo-ligase